MSIKRFSKITSETSMYSYRVFECGYEKEESSKFLGVAHNLSDCRKDTFHEFINSALFQVGECDNINGPVNGEIQPIGPGKFCYGVRSPVGSGKIEFVPLYEFHKI